MQRETRTIKGAKKGCLVDWGYCFVHNSHFFEEALALVLARLTIGGPRRSWQQFQNYHTSTILFDCIISIHRQARPISEDRIDIQTEAVSLAFFYFQRYVIFLANFHSSWSIIESSSSEYYWSSTITSIKMSQFERTKSHTEVQYSLVLCDSWSFRIETSWCLLL